MTKALFEIADDKTFDENMKVLGQQLGELDGDLGPVLEKHLSNLADSAIDKSIIWDALLAAVPEQKA